MIKIFAAICWFFVFAKLLFFWVWLWQLKEYHWARFRAYFESNGLKKFIFSFYGIRYPKITLKIVFILLSGVLAGFFILYYLFSFSGYLFYFFLLTSIIFLPVVFSLLVLFFQIPTEIFKKNVLKKAENKIKEFSNQGGLVVGITGSYGKSSTKEFLAAILSKKFNVLKTEKNINSEIGIAQTILKKLSPGHQIFVVEIGAYEKGKIKEVCRMVKPKIGILTGINEQHLSTFGSQENIIKAKFELIESLPKDGTAILNFDNEYIKAQSLKRKAQGQDAKFKTIRCSTLEKFEIWTENIIIEKEYIRFKVFSKDGDSADFKMNLLGRQNIENVLLAVACAKTLGMSLKEISMACSKIKSGQGGIKFFKKITCQKTGKYFIVLDSSYSANPTGVIADLDYLKIYPEKKIVVMPCLIELNKKAEEIHKKIGRKIAEICDLAIITTNDYFQFIKEGAREGKIKEENILLIKDPEEIVTKIKFYGANSIVLLEGRIPKKVIDLLINKI